MNNAIIRIAYADDHDALRQGLVALLNQQSNIEVVADAPNGRVLLNQITQLKELPDVVILDVEMPVMDGYETAKQIASKYPAVKSMAYSFYASEFNITKMIQSGASGYLSKRNSSVEVVWDAVQKVHKDGSYFSKGVDEVAIRKMLRSQLPVITEKELDFLKYCAEGLSCSEIAEKMFVSPRSLEYYGETLHKKLGLKTRAAQLAFALKAGLIALSS